jgi:hypothetical protein
MTNTGAAKRAQVKAVIFFFLIHIPNRHCLSSSNGRGRYLINGSKRLAQYPDLFGQQLLLPFHQIHREKISASFYSIAAVIDHLFALVMPIFLFLDFA